MENPKHIHLLLFIIVTPTPAVRRPRALKIMGGSNNGCISSFNLILNLKIWSMQHNFASFIVKVHSLYIKDIRILRLFKILNFSYGVIEYLMNINEADEQILGKAKYFKV